MKCVVVIAEIITLKAVSGCPNSKPICTAEYRNDADEATSTTRRIEALESRWAVNKAKANTDISVAKRKALNARHHHEITSVHPP